MDSWKMERVRTAPSAFACTPKLPGSTLSKWKTKFGNALVYFATKSCSASCLSDCSLASLSLRELATRVRVGLTDVPDGPATGGRSTPSAPFVQRGFRGVEVGSILTATAEPLVTFCFLEMDTSSAAGWAVAAVAWFVDVEAERPGSGRSLSLRVSRAARLSRGERDLALGRATADMVRGEGKGWGEEGRRQVVGRGGPDRDETGPEVFQAL